MVDLFVVLTNENNGKRKKYEAINPERGTQNPLAQTDRMFRLWAIPRSIEVYDHFYLIIN